MSCGGGIGLSVGWFEVGQDGDGFWHCHLLTGWPWINQLTSSRPSSLFIHRSVSTYFIKSREFDESMTQYNCTLSGCEFPSPSGLPPELLNKNNKIIEWNSSHLRDYPKHAKLALEESDEDTISLAPSSLKVSGRSGRWVLPPSSLALKLSSPVPSLLSFSFGPLSLTRLSLSLPFPASLSIEVETGPYYTPWYGSWLRQ